MAQASIDKDEMARRLDWLLTFHMLPEDREEWPEKFKAPHWREVFDLKTPGVQELTRNWVDWITGVTDTISDSHLRIQAEQTDDDRL